MRTEEIFYLNGIYIFAARDDNVLFAVNKIYKAFAVTLCHVARIQPALVVENLFCRFGVAVIAFHNAGSLYRKLSDAVGDLLAVFIYNADLPAVAGNSDSAYLVDIAHAEVNAAGSDRLAQTVVCVIFVVREYRLPALDKGRGNGLSADVHQSPTAQVVFAEVDLTAVDSVKNILRPRNKQPYDRAALLAYGADYPLGAYSAQNNRLAARIKASEPVHLCARVIERRNTQKNVVLCLMMMSLLNLCGVHKRAVSVQNSLRKARCAR